jgi:hypothetical protein
MATRLWKGGAQVTPWVKKVTPANVAPTNTFTLTLGGGKTFVYTATGSTVAEVTAGLLALVQASQEGDVTELAFADKGTLLQVTGPADGAPFFLNGSASGGTATLTPATVTTGSSPYDVGLAANWQTPAGVTGVPVGGDDVIVDDTSVPMKYSLDALAGITLNSRYIGPGFSGSQIGLPEVNATRGYVEYRPTHWQVAVTSDRVEANACGLVKLDARAIQTDLLVIGVGSSVDSTQPALNWIGSHASNTVELVSGNIGLASLYGQTATINTLKVGGGQGGQLTVTGGSGLTLGAGGAKQIGGDVRLYGSLTSWVKNGGTLTVVGAGGATTLVNDGGTVVWMSSGGITAYDGAGVLDKTRDPRALTITNATYRDGAEVRDGLGTITHTNPFVATLTKVKLDFGVRRNIQVT